MGSTLFVLIWQDKHIEKADAYPVLQLIFDELIGKAREKEEKEAKRRKRLEDNFHEYLRTSKVKSGIILNNGLSAVIIRLICQGSFVSNLNSLLIVCRFGEENLFQELFERFIAELKEKAKEREKRKEEKAKKDKDRRERQKRKDKHRREKERDTESRRGKERHSKDGIESERTDSYNKEESKRSTGRDEDRKNRKRNSLEDMSADENEKERSRDSRRHSSDRKKPKQMEQAWTTETDSESQPTIHKKDDVIVSRWTGGTGDGEHIEREATDSE
ncbi:hypothetical protein Leryth_008461 [Lithospermum erythrorhizon]|nr:hypothetical protein Leryth_008461 [Lithospermum erythrorhizon]